MFNLSGVIDVLLFLIIRPQLLLFPRPKELDRQEIQLNFQGTGPASFSDTEKFQHSSEPTSATLMVDEGSRNCATQSRVSSRLSDDI
jgi:hypothetical protein